MCSNVFSLQIWGLLENVKKRNNRFGDIIYKFLTHMIFYTSLVGVYSVNSMIGPIATHAMERQSLIWTLQHFKLFKVCETITQPLAWKILIDYQMSYPGPTFGRILKSYHEYWKSSLKWPLFISCPFYLYYAYYLNF